MRNGKKSNFNSTTYALKKSIDNRENQQITQVITNEIVDTPIYNRPKKISMYIHYFLTGYPMPLMCLYGGKLLYLEPNFGEVL